MERLESRGIGITNEYRQTLKKITNDEDGDLRELHVHSGKTRVLISQVSNLYPDQIDLEFTYKCLVSEIVEWIKQGYKLSDQKQLRQSAEHFLKKVVDGIEKFVVYVPIEGLDVTLLSNDIRLGRCQLVRNISDSELKKLLCVLKDRFPDNQDAHYLRADAVSAYCKINAFGHPNQVENFAKRETDLTLNILRLYWGSHFFDIHMHSPLPVKMGRLGTLQSSSTLVFTVRDEDPLDFKKFYINTQAVSYSPTELDGRKVSEMQNLALAKINDYIDDRETGKSTDIARRLFRAIDWFAKGTVSENFEDSFLMYAIAAESLLSEGRTPKEDYAIRIAAVVSQDKSKIIFPLDGYLSSAFSKDVRVASDQSARFVFIQKRVEELFDIRNDIAHGSELKDGIAYSDLLDFETLVRNSILSFVLGDWQTLGEFKTWVNQSVSYSFSPTY